MKLGQLVRKECFTQRVCQFWHQSGVDSFDLIGRQGEEEKGQRQGTRHSSQTRVAHFWHIASAGVPQCAQTSSHAAPDFPTVSFCLGKAKAGGPGFHITFAFNMEDAGSH